MWKCGMQRMCLSCQEDTGENLLVIAADQQDPSNDPPNSLDTGSVNESNSDDRPASAIISYESTSSIELSSDEDLSMESKLQDCADEQSDEESNIQQFKRLRQTYRQDDVSAQILTIDEKIWKINKKTKLGYPLSGAEETDLEKLVENKNGLVEKKLELQKKAERQRKFRERQRDRYEQLLHNVDDQSRAAFAMRVLPGQPSLLDREPILHQVIMRLLSHDLQASDTIRLQTMISTCRTPDNIYDTVRKELPDLPISRSGLYFQFFQRILCQPPEKDVNTVRVRLKTPEKTKRKQHPDSHFCFAAFKHVRNLIEMLGDDSVFLVSQDDKARVPIGIEAATVQKSMVMRLDRPARLPDHDYVLGEGHKLIPSVYAVGSVDKNCEVKYSGPTAVYIRIAKYDKTSHATHAYDIQELVENPAFTSFSRTKAGSFKPVHVVMTDGGPDENPRFCNAVTAAIQQFENTVSTVS